MKLWLDADAVPRDVKDVCFRKGIVVIDPRGEEYTAEIIGERLSVRNFMDGLRGAGVETGGHAAWGPREKQAFANSLDRVLTRSLRRR